MLDRIRQQPVGVRQRRALLGALGITVFLGVWWVTAMLHVNDGVEAGVATSSPYVLESVRGSFDQLRDGWQEIRDAVSEIGDSIPESFATSSQPESIETSTRSATGMAPVSTTTPSASTSTRDDRS